MCASEVEPEVEPEDCDGCTMRHAIAGVEYTQEMTWDSESLIWICDNCGAAQ